MEVVVDIVKEVRQGKEDGKRVKARERGYDNKNKKYFIIKNAKNIKKENMHMIYITLINYASYIYMVCVLLSHKYAHDVHAI